MFNDIDFVILFVVGGATGAILLGGLRYLHTPIQKTFFAMGVLGTWLLCGLGAAYERIPFIYIIFYSNYLFILITSFILTIKMLQRWADGFSGWPAIQITRFTQNRMFIVGVLSIYFLTFFLNMVYPEMRIQLLWNPPQPDITFFTGIPEERSLYQFILQYIYKLVFPFYLISLYSFRKRYVWLAVLLILPLYLRLCATGYIGRGDFIICIGIYVLIMWLDNPRRRVIIGSLGLIIAFFLIYFFYVYGFVRGGIYYMARGVPMVEGIQEFIYEQTSFPILFEKVLYSGQQSNLYDYFKWIITTPIPKLISGELPGARVNLEIAEIIRGIAPGMRGFTVDLTGVVTESVYIYGQNFFWIHPIFISLIFGFLCSLTEKIPCFMVISIYFILHFGYILPRAGIAATWPPLVNDFLSLYIVLCIFRMRKPVRRRLTYNHKA